MTFTVYIENLSIVGFVSILRQLVLLSNNKSRTLSVFYIDGSPIAIRLARWFVQINGWNLSKLSFNLLDVREEESGDFIRLCIQTDYLWKIKDSILKKYPNFLPTEEEEIKLRSYLEKSIVCDGIEVPRSLARTIYLVHVIRLKMIEHAKKDSTLILSAQPWGEVLKEYAKSFGVQLIYNRHIYIIWPSNTIKNYWRILIEQWVRQIFLIYFPKAIYWLRFGFFFFHKKTNVGKTSSPKIVVYPQGQWNFENNGLNSEIFLNFQSNLPTHILLFPLPNITPHLYSEFSKLQISTCVVNRVPPSNISTPFFLGTANTVQSHSPDLSELPPLEKRQIQYLLGEYSYIKSFWKEFFSEHNVKIYTSWHKNGERHIPIGDALKELGGIMTVWQRSYEEIPDVGLSTDADISFGFSPKLVNTEKLQGSKIKYHVATGFIKDYNQKLLRPKSIHIRKKLMSKGAKKIVSVFDENSIDDSRWHTGHELPRKHYGFWSEKVLQEPWLGVIFKPKKPKTLRHRLGDVNFLVTEAEKTGRLVILEEASENASIIPPVLAAMASDIAIQGHFFAGTTALECALAGVPSLAVDYEGWKRSFRYQLGEGKVIFPNNENLWDVLMEHWNSKNGVPGLGDWSPIINDLDPFRDGRAAERMGNYLHWLIQGFEQGLDRDTIMADAAERYCKQWGSDKISPVN